MDTDKPRLVLVPNGGPIPDETDPPYEIVARDDLDTRIASAFLGVADWYAEAQRAEGEEASFYWGRQLYHVMQPVMALTRKLRGQPPEQPCTNCGTEEGGASSGPDGNGGRFSLCPWCARDRDGA